MATTHWVSRSSGLKVKNKERNQKLEIETNTIEELIKKDLSKS